LGSFANDQALDEELAELEKKMAAGASSLSPRRYSMWSDFPQPGEDCRLNVPVIATVFLLKSVGIARYMALNEPGAAISEEMIKRIRKAPDREWNA
jgi:methylenetetrahydrofolate reductase (NADPH)